MREQNQTLAYYEKNADSYAAREFIGTFEEYRNHFVASVRESSPKKETLIRETQQGQKTASEPVPSRPKVLELGSGSGRDAQAFLTNGFDVIPVDGCAELARIARERTGLDVLVMDFADLDFDAEFDGIWAAASLLHVPSQKLPGVLKSVEKSLRENGVFVASFKESDEDWVDDLGRYFCAMTENHLADLIENCGLELTSIEKAVGKGSDGKPTVWLWAIARKQTLTASQEASLVLP